MKLIDSEEDEEGYINASYINVKIIRDNPQRSFNITFLLTFGIIFFVFLMILFDNSSYLQHYFSKGVHMGIGKNKFIATQGPLPETLGHFWKMVWNESVQCIVMLCNLKVKFL